MGLFKKASNHLVKLLPGDREFEVGAKETVLQAALKAQVAFPHDCRVGTCGTCKCRLKNGKIRPLLDYSYVLSREELDQGYILACQTILRSDVEIQLDRLSDLPNQAVQRRQGVIRERRDLTRDILELAVEVDDKFRYLAGQYADLQVPDVDVVRSYSFADCPDPEGNIILRFYIRKVADGRLSSWLHAHAREGQKLIVEGPYGSFGLRASERPILSVAGGSGLAPIKAILEQAAKEGCKRPLHILFGARTRKDLYGLEALKELEQTWNGPFEFQLVLSEEPETSEWSGKRGLVTDWIQSDLISWIGESEAYLCGPPPMVDSAIKRLGEYGVGADRIFYDKF